MNPITINPDGHSIKGCSIIYAPAGQAGEYAKLATNPYRGCGHGCVYCYVPAVLKMSRAEFDAGAVPRDEFLTRLTKDARKYQAAGVREQVMLSFTTDPYHPGDSSLTRQTIEVLRSHGLGFCALTKGGGRALRDLDLFRPERDAFASTLTSIDDAVSLEWEPKAALPIDRMKTLERFHRAGIFTWVSLEPVYNTEATLEIIERTRQYVDLYKIGRINYHRAGREIDWREFTHRAVELFAKLGARHYVKQDLQPYLPAGYSNPRYVNQARERIAA
jgi:DNA repair photolyase